MKFEITPAGLAFCVKSLLFWFVAMYSLPLVVGLTARVIVENFKIGWNLL